MAESIQASGSFRCEDGETVVCIHCETCISIRFFTHVLGGKLYVRLN
jgi:hypothetical protein